MTEHPKKSVLFISTWINNPDLIPVQRDLLRTFCHENATLLVVLDGKSEPCFTNFGNASMRDTQRRICQEHGIDFIEVPRDFHQEPQRSQLFQSAIDATGPPALYTTAHRNYILDPSSRTAVANQFGYQVFLQHLRSKFDYLVMLQSDIFPFAPFSVKDMLAGNSLLYKSQTRTQEGETIEYAWDGCLFFDCSIEPTLNWAEWNFECGIQKKVVFTDTGGGTWCFLPKIQKKQAIDAKNSLQWTAADPEFATLPLPIRDFLQNDIRNEGERLFAEIKHHTFIHLRGGGNWEFIQNLEAGRIIQQERFASFYTCYKQLTASC